MTDRALAVTTTAAKAVAAHAGRTVIGFTNTGAADEIVYASSEPAGGTASAWTIYNRETLKITGAYARKSWWLVASANVTVNISEEF